MKSKIIWRIAATLALITLYGYLSVVFSIGAHLALGDVGVDQLRNSDAAIIQLTFMQKITSGSYGVLVLLLLLLGLWYPVLKNAVTKSNEKYKSSNGMLALLGSTALLLTFLTPQPAEAYYDKTDRAEWAEIGANQSAFMIPMIGANKDKQAQFGSVEYLQANKVSAKRVQLPHAKADNTSMFMDYYVSTHRLYLLDRTPYAREWHKESTKGTSQKSQGFRFESADSLTIETAVAISAFVKEEDAAKFFYWFGAAPSAVINTDPATVFSSIANGRSLADVMDSIVRPRVQTLLAKGYGKFKLMEGIARKADIMEEVEKTLKTEFAEQGITIRNVGYADELTLSPSVQGVLDEMFSVQVRYSNREAYTTTLAIDQKRAEIGVTNATAATMQKWNGQINLPSFFVGSSEFIKSIMGFFRLGNDSKEIVKK